MFNLLRRKKAKESPQQELQDSKGVPENVLDTQQRFQQILGPSEAYLMMTQRVLVWENPKYTAVFFIFANLLFWLATTTRIYRLLGLTGLVAVFVDMWVSRIWPEIRLPPPEGSDTEGWTPVYPRLLSVPEISHHLATLSVRTRACATWLYRLRKRSHSKFFFLMVLLFGSGAVLGTYVSGILMLYISVQCILLIPGLLYHRLYDHVFIQLEPYLERVEKTFNIKRKKSRRGKRRSLTPRGEDSDSSDDNELHQLRPTFSEPPASASEPAGHLRPPGGTAGEQHSVGGHSTENSDQEDSSVLPPSSIPHFDDSRLDDSCSDQEHGDPRGRLEVPNIQDAGSDSDLDMTVTEGIAVPARETLRGGDEAEEDLAGDSSDSSMNVEQESSAIMFQERHFKASSSSSAGSLADVEDELEGLMMPDMDDVDSSAVELPDTGMLGALASQVVGVVSSVGAVGSQGMLGQLSQSVVSAVTRDSVTSLMQNTVAGLTRMGESVTGSANPGNPGNNEHSGSSLTSGDVQSETSKQTMAGQPSQSSSMTECEIMAEFDFLDDAGEEGGQT